ncbi:MAG: hypothetical protein IV101_19960 [Dechloromonas sp.]|nr:hypothetical protein [Dechloromonas sp.]
MRGFLHQLATRSLGLAPQIKSRAALPYAAPAADFSMPETAANEIPPAIERPGFGPQTDVRRNEQAMDSPLPAPIVAENPAPDTPVERPSSPPGTSQPPSLSARPSPDMTPPETTPIRQAPPPAVLTSPVVAEQKPAPRHLAPAPETRGPAENPRPTLAELESLVTRLLIGDKPGHSEKSPESVTPPPIVTPRRAGQRPAEITTIRPPPGAQRQRPTPEPDSAPEVHITIGRLEVNPPSRPAPATLPPRPRGPAPLSLSDYLARRHGGRS